MHTVREILERKGHAVERIEGSARVTDAAVRMNEHRIGALVVTRQDRVVGIFTERDILNRVVAAGRDPAGTKVEDVMTAPVAVCSPESTRAECRSVMKSRRIRHLPVVHDDVLFGIVSIGDLLEDHGAESDETIRLLFEYMYGEWTASPAQV